MQLPILTSFNASSNLICLASSPSPVLPLYNQAIRKGETGFELEDRFHLFQEGLHATKQSAC